MEVKEFVKTILKEVTEAILESNTERYHFRLPEQEDDGIEFDLAVVSKQEGKGKVRTIILDGEGSLSNEAVNRIKFRVKTWKKG